MKIGIIGHSGHGKSTLIEAIKAQEREAIELIELKTKDLLEESKAQEIKESDFIEIYKRPNREERRGNKNKLKNWQRDKFWQK